MRILNSTNVIRPVGNHRRGASASRTFSLLSGVGGFTERLSLRFLYEKRERWRGVLPNFLE